MKIFFVINRFAGGGAERVMSTLANYFASSGEEVYIDYDTDYPSAYKLNDKIISLNHISKLRRSWAYKIGILRFPYKLFLLRKNIKSIHPDVVVSFVTENNGPLILAALGLKTKLIVSEHSRVEGFNNSRKNEFIKKYIYRLADAVTVLTRHDYNKWKKYGNVVRMPNPISLEVDDVDISKKSKVVLGVGRLDDYKIKGLDTLLKCWSGVCHKYPDWRLQVAGDGTIENKQILQDISDSLQNINVDFLGFRKDINSVMRDSAIFLLSSRVEGLPMGLIEAMNQSCCCVAFDVETGPSEIIRNNISGLLVENQNVDALTNALEKVLSDENLRFSLSNNAKSEVTKYGVERIINRWRVLFGLLENKSLR